MKNMKYPIEDLIQIMNDLRDKCPWDKKQTLKSLKSLIKLGMMFHSCTQNFLNTLKKK